MGQTPTFDAVRIQIAGEPYSPPMFLCPKCGWAETKLTWEHALNLLACTCGRCGFHTIRPTLETGPDEEED